MANEIIENLVYLSENITNIPKILLHLRQNHIISENESQEIKSEKTDLDKNEKLLSLMEKKNWSERRSKFLEILRDTGNDHCANFLEEQKQKSAALQWQISNGCSSRQTTSRAGRKRTRMPKTKEHNKIQKWFPDKKFLIDSLYKRKMGDKMFVEVLHEKILKDKRQMAVICEALAASKYSGLGGVGKTLTAKWYAHHYEDEYQHILWIDCHQGSLLQSFRKLARDLEIRNRKEFAEEAEEFARKSYEKLMEFKCLWIFDNVESYLGSDGRTGIIRFLPKHQENFYCMITSRSNEWGSENGLKVSEFQLDVFSEKESLEFLKTNLKIPYTEIQLLELCQILGNLPLALQLAVAALNNGKIDLLNYIEKTTLKDSENIVNKNFDDYESTINKNIKISFDMLLEENNGSLALYIILIFGYIPSHHIRQKFFEDIFNCTNELENAIELLVKYSLISKEFPKTECTCISLVRSRYDEDTDDDDGMNVGVGNDKVVIYEDKSAGELNVHPLIQQVVRQNGRERENATLRKILCCRGFIDYKVISFLKYADDQLRNEFPEIKMEILEPSQNPLKWLLNDERLKEAVQLARFVDNELQTNITKLNLFVCLERNKQMSDALAILEELYQQNIDEETSEVHSGVMSFTEILGKKFVRGLLLITYFRLQNITGVDKILNERKPIVSTYSRDLQTTYIEILRSTKIQSYYFLLCYNKLTYSDFDESFIELKFDSTTTKGIEFVECHLSCNTSFPTDLEELNLISITLTSLNGKPIQRFDLSDWIPKSVLKIKFKSFLSPKYILSIKRLSCFQWAWLENYFLDLDCCNDRYLHLPSHLALLDVSFIISKEKLQDMAVNKWFSLKCIDNLILRCDNKSNSNKSVSMQELLFGDNAKVVDWKETSMTLGLLTLIGIPYLGKTKLSMTTLIIDNASLDISILPQTLKKLIICNTNVILSGSIDLPKLKHLELDGYSGSVLANFSSMKLTYIHLNEMEEVNVDLIPETVSEVKITKTDSTKIIGGVKKVCKLTLAKFYSYEEQQDLDHFEAVEIVTFQTVFGELCEAMDSFREFRECQHSCESSSDSDS